MARESDLHSAEEAKPQGSTANLWEMQVENDKEEQWYCARCYRPLSDKERVAQWLLPHAIRAQPKRMSLLVLDDLNADLDATGGYSVRRAMQLSLSCSTRHYIREQDHSAHAGER